MGFAHREAAGVCAEVVWWSAFQERYVVVGVDDVVGGEVDAFGVVESFPSGVVGSPNISRPGTVIMRSVPARRFAEASYYGWR